MRSFNVSLEGKCKGLGMNVNSLFISHCFQSLIQDVDNHKEDLESLAAMVHAVLELVDEDDCKALGSQLREVTSDYDELRFDCSCYPSERWLEAHTSQLCSLAPCGVVVAPLQVQ